MNVRNSSVCLYNSLRFYQVSSKVFKKIIFFLISLYTFYYQKHQAIIVRYIFKFTTRCMFEKNYLNTSNERAKISFAFVRFVACLIFTAVTFAGNRKAHSIGHRVHSAYMHVCPRRLIKRIEIERAETLSNGRHFTNMNNRLCPPLLQGNNVSPGLVRKTESRLYGRATK